MPQLNSIEENLPAVQAPESAAETDCRPAIRKRPDMGLSGKWEMPHFKPAAGSCKW
jgi:hypothetical protein